MINCNILHDNKLYKLEFKISTTSIWKGKIKARWWMLLKD